MQSAAKPAPAANLAIGQRYRASDGTGAVYTIRDLDGALVEVLREPRPSWAGPAWIAIPHFAAVADLAALPTAKA